MNHLGQEPEQFKTALSLGGGTAGWLDLGKQPAEATANVRSFHIAEGVSELRAPPSEK